MNLDWTKQTDKVATAIAANGADVYVLRTAPGFTEPVDWVIDRISTYLPQTVRQGEGQSVPLCQEAAEAAFEDLIAPKVVNAPESDIVILERYGHVYAVRTKVPGLVATVLDTVGKEVVIDPDVFPGQAFSR